MTDNLLPTKLGPHLIGEVVTLQKFDREPGDKDSLKPGSLISITGRLLSYRKHRDSTFVSFEGQEQDGWWNESYHVEWYVYLGEEE